MALYPWVVGHGPIWLWFCHQHPKPSDPGGAPPTCASINWHTDLGPSCGSWRGLWTGPALRLQSVKEPWENTELDNHPWTRQPFWKSRSPAENFLHTVGGKKKKKKSDRSFRESKKNNLTFPHHPYPKAAQFSVEITSLPIISPLSKSEWVTSFPSYARCWQRGPFLSPHSGNELHNWGTVSGWNSSPGSEWNVPRGHESF